MLVGESSFRKKEVVLREGHQKFFLCFVVPVRNFANPYNSQLGWITLMARQISSKTPNDYCSQRSNLTKILWF